MKWRPFFVVALVGMLVLAILPAQAASVTPTRVNGNSTCASIGSNAEFSLKLEPVTAGPHPGEGDVVITISNLSPAAMPTMFDFSITGGAVRDVIVKGSAANWYDYDFGEGGSSTTGDTGLKIPNGNSLKSVTFCYDDLAAEIAGTKFNDADASGTNNGDLGKEGWQIFLLTDTGGFVASTFTDSNGDYTFPDPGSGDYVVCEGEGPAGEGWFQTGPLEPENDVCPDTADDGGGVDITITSVFNLNPGGYAVSYTSGDSVTGLDFFNYDGEEGASGQPLPCGGTASTGDTSPFGSFTREFSEGCDDSVVKNALVGVEGDEVFFVPRGLGTSDYSGFLSFTKESVDPFLIRLQYDPDDSGPAPFKDVPACEYVDDGGGEGPITAGVPDGDTWCFYEVVANAPSTSEGLWEVTWQVFGFGDPRFK